MYKASVNYANVTGYAGGVLSAAEAAIAAAELSKASFLGTSADAVLTFAVDAYDCIKSCFAGNLL